MADSFQCMIKPTTIKEKIFYKSHICLWNKKKKMMLKWSKSALEKNFFSE